MKPAKGPRHGKRRKTARLKTALKRKRIKQVVRASRGDRTFSC